MCEYLIMNNDDNDDGDDDDDSDDGLNQSEMSNLFVYGKKKTTTNKSIIKNNCQ